MSRQVRTPQVGLEVGLKIPLKVALKVALVELVAVAAPVLVGLVGVVGSTVLLPRPAQAAPPSASQVRSQLPSPFNPEGQDWEGLSQLVKMARSELGPAHVTLESTLSMHDLKREDGLLLVHPERPLDADALESFMRAGGRVIVLDDYGTGDELLAHFGMRRISLPTHGPESLRGNPSFAIAQPASVHPIVRDIAPVVTNHATGLEQHGLSPLLVVHGGNGEPDVLLSVAGAVGQGRLIVIGDSSISMNTMLRYPGNRALSNAVLHYATDDDVWGKRGGTLHILVNDFRMTGSFGDDSRGMARLGEAERSARRWLRTLRHDGIPASVAYTTAIAICLWVIAWVSTRVGRTHKTVMPNFARPVPRAVQGGIAGHAAVLGSPTASRVLALIELKAALEEALATRLGLDRAPPHDELAAKLLATGVLDRGGAQSLSSLLGRLELAPMGRTGRVRDANVIAAASEVGELLKAARQP